MALLQEQVEEPAEIFISSIPVKKICIALISVPSLALKTTNASLFARNPVDKNVLMLVANSTVLPHALLVKNPALG